MRTKKRTNKCVGCGSTQAKTKRRKVFVVVVGTSFEKKADDETRIGATLASRDKMVGKGDDCHVPLSSPEMQLRLALCDGCAMFDAHLLFWGAKDLYVEDNTLLAAALKHPELTDQFVLVGLSEPNDPKTATLTDLPTLQWLKVDKIPSAAGQLLSELSEQEPTNHERQIVFVKRRSTTGGETATQVAG